MKILISTSSNWLKNIRESKIPTNAVHYGDLGIGHDTTRQRMDGGRSTGFYGTGVYFVSVGAKAGARENRPIKYLNLSDLNLYKPSDSERALQLHKLLKLVIQLSETDDRYWQKKETSELVTKIKQGAEIFKRNSYFSRILENECEAEYTGLPESEIRTISTRIMQKLGYDGIDVRHTNLDNMDYGSVVFASR